MTDASIRGVLQNRTFLLVVTTSILASGAINMISPALPALATGLNVSEAKIGLLITAFTLPSIFVLPISGYLSDRFGRHALMAVGSIIIGIGGLLSFIYMDFWPIVLFRIIQGIGYAGVMPMTVAMIGDLYEDRKETTAQGLRTSFNKGASIGWMMLGGAIAAVGWHYIFLVYAACIPLGILLYFGVPAYTPEQKPLSTYFDELIHVVKEPKITLYLSIGFLRFFLKYGLITFLPLLLVKRFQLTPTETGLYMGILGAAGIISAAMAGKLDARDRKTSSVFTAILAIGAAYSIIAVTHNIPLLVTMLVFIGLADAAMSPLHKSLLTHNVDKEHRGGIIAANSLGQSLGKTAGPLTLGLLTFAGYTTLFLSAGLFAMFSVINYLYLRNFLATRNLYP